MNYEVSNCCSNVECDYCNNHNILYKNNVIKKVSVKNKQKKKQTNKQRNEYFSYYADCGGLSFVKMQNKDSLLGWRCDRLD